MKRKEAERVLLAQTVQDQSLGALVKERISPEHFGVFPEIANEIWKNADKYIPSRASAEKKCTPQDGEREAHWKHAPETWDPSPEDVPEALVVLRECHVQDRFNRTLFSARHTLKEPDGWKRLLTDLPRDFDEISSDLRREDSGGSKIPRASLTSDPTPPEELVERLLLRGDVHHLFADADNGKSWIALWLAKQALIKGYKVLYLDYENGPKIIRERLKVHLKVDAHLLEEGTFFYSSAPSLDFTQESLQEYLTILKDFAPDLIIWDSWAPALGSCGVDESSNFDLAKWSGIFLTPARNEEITTVILDHVPHGGDRARGASRKRDFVDIQWLVKKTSDFDRQTVGAVELRRRKDRESWLPEKVGFDIGGTPFKCEPWGFSEFDVLLTANAHKLKKFLEENPDGVTWSQITKEIFNGNDSATKRAVEKLQEFDLIEHKGKLYFLCRFGGVTSASDPGMEVPNRVEENKTQNEAKMGASSENGLSNGKTPRDFHTSTSHDEEWKLEVTDTSSALGISVDTQAEASVVPGSDIGNVLEIEEDTPRDNGSASPGDWSSHTRLPEVVRECEQLFEREPNWIPHEVHDDEALYTYALGLSWASPLFDKGLFDEKVIFEALKIIYREEVKAPVMEPQITS